MGDIQQKLEELNSLILKGKAIEGFEKFYHADVTMQENSAPPTVGKKANLQREMEFFGNILAFNEAQVHGMAINGNMSFVIWKFNYVHKEWGHKNYVQVSVQEWKDGLIISERFFYDN